MNLFSFSAHFGTKEDRRNHISKSKEIYKVLFMISVAARSIIGKKISGVMNVKVVNTERPYEKEPYFQYQTRNKFTSW